LDQPHLPDVNRTNRRSDGLERLFSDAILGTCGKHAIEKVEAMLSSAIYGKQRIHPAHGQSVYIPIFINESTEISTNGAHDHLVGSRTAVDLR
jgi:hypothetical protein